VVAVPLAIVVPLALISPVVDPAAAALPLVVSAPVAAPIDVPLPTAPADSTDTPLATIPDPVPIAPDPPVVTPSDPEVEPVPPADPLGAPHATIAASTAIETRYDRLIPTLLPARDTEWRANRISPRVRRPRRSPYDSRYLYETPPAPITSCENVSFVAICLRSKLSPRTAESAAANPFLARRHTFCSHLAMRGAPGKAIKELAGHEDLTFFATTGASELRVTQTSAKRPKKGSGFGQFSDAGTTGYLSQYANLGPWGRHRYLLPQTCYPNAVGKREVASVER